VPTRGAVAVPRAAIVPRPPGPQVAQIDRSGRLRFRAVSIARDDGALVELSSGVSAGQLLAAHVSDQLVDGDAVTVHGSSPTATAALVLPAPR
jgi:hypothetical protein